MSRGRSPMCEPADNSMNSPETSNNQPPQARSSQVWDPQPGPSIPKGGHNESLEFGNQYQQPHVPERPGYARARPSIGITALEVLCGPEMAYQGHNEAHLIPAEIIAPTRRRGHPGHHESSQCQESMVSHPQRASDQSHRASSKGMERVDPNPIEPPLPFGMQYRKRITYDELREIFPIKNGQNRVRPHVPLTWRRLGDSMKPVGTSGAGPSGNEVLQLSPSTKDPTMDSKDVALRNMQTTRSDEAEATSDTEWAPDPVYTSDDEGYAIESASEDEFYEPVLRRSASAPDGLGGAAFGLWNGKEEPARYEDEASEESLPTVNDAQLIEVLHIAARLKVVEGIVCISPPAAGAAPATPPPPHPSLTRRQKLALAIFFIPFLVYTATLSLYHRAIPPLTSVDIFANLSIAAVDLAATSQTPPPRHSISLLSTYDFTPSIDATQKYDICVRHETPTWTLRQEMRVLGLDDVVARVAQREGARRLRFGHVWALMVVVLGAVWAAAIGARRLWNRVEGVCWRVWEEGGWDVGWIVRLRREYGEWEVVVQVAGACVVGAGVFVFAVVLFLGGGG